MGEVNKIKTIEDATAAERKRDHIDMALNSQVLYAENDCRFYYEPMLNGHPVGEYPKINFLEKQFNFPIWVSSMTGGTALAGKINENLARACKDFGLGMGLGSCRQLLYDETYLADFQVRQYIGDQPLYANLGIAQVEKLVLEKKWDVFSRLIDKLSADGLIVHVNPLQEWMQPEGDNIFNPPIDTIETFLQFTNIPLIVKEVGQGMGKESLRKLLQLPLAAIDFAAIGGTNFSKLELSRNLAEKAVFEPMVKVGHTAYEMTLMVNQLCEEMPENIKCKQIIISGGIKDFLDGYHLINLCKLPSLYGQASQFLKYAMDDYEKLYQYVLHQTEGLQMAKRFLTLK